MTAFDIPTLTTGRLGARLDTGAPPLDGGPCLVYRHEPKGAA